MLHLELLYDLLLHIFFGAYFLFILQAYCSSYILELPAEYYINSVF